MLYILLAIIAGVVFECGERAYLCGVDGRKFILKSGSAQ